MTENKKITFPLQINEEYRITKDINRYGLIVYMLRRGPEELFEINGAPKNGVFHLKFADDPYRSYRKGKKKRGFRNRGEFLQLLGNMLDAVERDLKENHLIREIRGRTNFKFASYLKKTHGAERAGIGICIAMRKDLGGASGGMAAKPKLALCAKVRKAL
jgi:hypothetical protein